MSVFTATSGAALLSPGGNLNTLVVSFLHPCDAALVRRLLPKTVAPHAEIYEDVILGYHAREGHLEVLKWRKKRKDFSEYELDIILSHATEGDQLLCMCVAKIWGARSNIAASRVVSLPAAILLKKWGYLVDDGLSEACSNLAKKGKLVPLKVVAGWEYELDDANHIDFEDVLSSAASGGHIRCMEFAQSLNESGFLDNAYRSAAKSGQLEAMQKLIEWGATGPDALWSAAETGQLKCMQLAKTHMDAQNPDSFDRIADVAVARAAHNAHLAIMQQLMKWGADISHELGGFISKAAACGYKEAIMWAYEQGGTVDGEDLTDAYKNGHTECVHLIKSMGVADFDSIMAAAAERGDVKMMETIKEWGYSAEGRYLHLAHKIYGVYVGGRNSTLETARRAIDLLTEWSGKRDFTGQLEEAFWRACNYDNTNWLKKLKALGAKNLDDCLEWARCQRAKKCMDQLIKWKKGGA